MTQTGTQVLGKEGRTLEMKFWGKYKTPFFFVFFILNFFINCITTSSKIITQFVGLTPRVPDMAPVAAVGGDVGGWCCGIAVLQEGAQHCSKWPVEAATYMVIPGAPLNDTRNLARKPTEELKWIFK